ncbi:MAG: TPM domain-containing protein [Deltaproteobacteria bacterium]|nr:TPM domain-containing protein [Deltaproteobacteria bacterium]
MRIIFVVLLFGLIIGCSASNNEFLEDPANLLSVSEKEHIEEYYEVLLKDLDIHFKTVFLKDAVPDIDQKAVEFFDRYQLGEKTRAAKGVLLLVDTHGKQVRMEIGYDLEGVFPDGFVGYVEEQQMVPFFAAGKVGPGVEATVELLVAQAMAAKEKADLVEEGADKGGVGAHYSGGAGAKTAINIGSGLPAKGVAVNPADFEAQSEPRLTLEKYLIALSQHVKDPNLGIYTLETRNFFKRWVVTDAQQDNEYRELSERISQGSVEISGEKAVILFPVDDRQTSPYFFHKGPDGWMLDFSGMSRWIRFNHKNQWHFKTLEHPYMFAFEKFVFDCHGFPHERRNKS